jgi:predicted nucleic acid-binding protein
MSHFPDTSFLCALYRPQDQSPLADAWIKKHQGSLNVSSLLLLEFRQSIRLQISLHERDRKKGFSKTEGSQMLKDLQHDLKSGVLEIQPVEWAGVHLLAEGLSAQYTMVEGYRFADILHVATALQEGAKQFLTFDRQQKKLALSAGLQVPW